MADQDNNSHKGGVVGEPWFPTDDNEEIMELLRGRLALGRERYGHGVRVDEDVTAFGPSSNDWEEMALEEMLDGLVYLTASIIRLRRRRRAEQDEKNDDESALGE